MTLLFSCSPVICEFRGRKPRKNFTCRKFYLFFFLLKMYRFRELLWQNCFTPYRVYCYFMWHLVIKYFCSCPANIYLFKVNYRNTEKRCEVCSKLTIKAPEKRQWRRSGDFIVNFKHTSQLFSVFLLLLWASTC